MKFPRSAGMVLRNTNLHQGSSSKPVSFKGGQNTSFGARHYGSYSSMRNGSRVSSK